MKTRYAFLSVFRLIAIAGSSRASGYTFTTPDYSGAGFKRKRGCMVRMLARAALLILLAASGSATAAQYTAVDLYSFPGAYSPTGAFGGQVTAAIWNDGFPTSVLWNPNGSASYLNVNDATWVAGTDGTHQFGWMRTGGIGYAPTFTPVVWTGSAASATFLNGSAQLTGSGGGKFVGTLAGGLSHALLWNSLTVQPIDLHPTNLVGFEHSFARGTSDTQQVGDVYGFDPNHNGYSHAVLWTGSAGSAVDLHPANSPGIVSSDALATDGRQQVGWGGPYSDSVAGHAFVWSGTANSAVDLNPAGFNDSVAGAVRNGKQVGSADSHAML